ncbi:MAG: type I-B CRISPR-associated protein Cas8b1/Cst1 [Thermoguttaceae bacterium]|nr:type I-B CRISPR-associated protein Cas8b1/Cst1 [Thermoguttaceae bacterium]
MDTLELSPGDFLKNAGIVGFLRLWEYVKQQRGESFAPIDRIDVQELLAVDLPQAYINTFIKYYGEKTKVAQALEKIDRLIEELEEKPGEVERKRLQEDVKFIVDSLSASSLKSGFEGIQAAITDCDAYLDFLKNKIKVPSPKEKLADFVPAILTQLKALQKFCSQPLVKQTFLFKLICYNIITNFWTDKSFLLRPNAKKDMIKLIDSDFIKPLAAFVNKTEYKSSGHCIVCGLPLASEKEKTSIAFLVDMADDLGRKTSAFWNCNVDAHLCPICAFLYALAPLGFCQVDNGDFVFINANESVDSLWYNNQPKMDNEGNPLSYHARMDNAILQLLESKAKIQNNIQVITRSKLENRYHFNVIDRQLIQLMRHKNVKSALKRLVTRPSFKISKDNFVNVYRKCIENMLNYCNQYNLLNLLVMESLKQTWINFFLAPVLDIQCAQLSQKEENLMNLSDLQHFASKAGGELRPILFADKVGQENVKSLSDEKKEDMIRGVVYQLTNALKVRNVEQFMDLVIRLYSACKLPIPTVFMQAIRSGDQFALIGYAFILGLKGAYYTKETKEEGEKNND